MQGDFAGAFRVGECGCVQGGPKYDGQLFIVMRTTVGRQQRDDVYKGDIFEFVLMGAIMKKTWTFFLVCAFLCCSDSVMAATKCLATSNTVTGVASVRSSKTYAMWKATWKMPSSGDGVSTLNTVTAYGVGHPVPSGSCASNGNPSSPTLYSTLDSSQLSQSANDGRGNRCVATLCYCRMLTPVVSKWVYVGTNTDASQSFVSCSKMCVPSGTVPTALVNAYLSGAVL